MKILLPLILFFVLYSLSEAQQLIVGKTAPPVHFDMVIKGNFSSPTDLKEKTTVLLFFSPEEKKSIRSLIKATFFAKQFASENTVFLSLCRGKNDTLDSFINEWKVETGLAADINGQTFKNYKISKTPYAYVINEKGKIVWYGDPMTFSERAFDKYFRTGEMPGFDFTISPSKGRTRQINVPVLEIPGEKTTTRRMGSSYNDSYVDILFEHINLERFIPVFFRFNSEPYQIDGKLPKKGYSISVIASGPVSAEEGKKYVKEILKQKFGIEIIKEERLVRIWRMRIKDDSKLIVFDSSGENRYTTRNKMICRGIKLEDLAEHYQISYKKHIINETKLAGKYYFETPAPYMAKFHEMKKYLKEKYNIYFVEDAVKKLVTVIKVKNSN